jgi:hypothetical protein
VLWLKVGLRGPTCQADRLARVAGRPSFLAAPTLGIGCPVHQPSLTRWQSRVWKGANTWPAGQGGGADRCHFGSVGPGLCVASSPHVIFSVTVPYFGHIEDMHGFWSIWCFPIIWCSWNGRSTKLVELVSNKHLSSISWMKFRYVGSKYMHFMTTNTSTLRVLLIPEQKKRIKSWGHKQELQCHNCLRIKNTTYNSYLSSCILSFLYRLWVIVPICSILVLSWA